METNLVGWNGKILIILVFIIPTIFSGCKKDEPNYPPVAILNVSPLKGEAPMDVHIQLTGTDPNGLHDIKQYKVTIGSEVVTSSSPIDIIKTMTIPNNYSVFGEVIDLEGASNKTPTTSVEATEKPYIDQTVYLFNYVQLSYVATLSKVNSAILTINKDGVLFLTQNITDIATAGSDFSKTYSFASDKVTKGTYEFILKSDNLEKRTSVTIPNYNPTINLSSIKPSLMENSSVNITLPVPADLNPEDTPTIIGAKSMDGKTQLSWSGNSLKVQALPDPLGNYQTPNFLGAFMAEIEFGSTIGGTVKATFSGTITLDPRQKLQKFTQPNDSTLNRYGTGDVNKDNVVNSADLTRIVEVINKTYSNPGDTRLLDRADVNGDGVVNNADRDLLEKRLNGSVAYMPGEWNKLKTRSEREDWVKKMLAIDKTNTIRYSPNFVCTQFSFQLMINFHGFSNPTVISYINVSYPFDFSNNGRFNLPMCQVTSAEYDAAGVYLTGHVFNTIIVGDDALVLTDYCNIEPQGDRMNLQPGPATSPYGGLNTTLMVGGTTIIPSCSGDKFFVKYFYYTTKDYIVSMINDYSPCVNLINRRRN